MVYGTGLENQRGSHLPGFESLTFRLINTPTRGIEMVVNRDVIFQFLGNSKNFGSRNSGLSNYRVFVISEPQGSVKKQKVNIISVSYVTSVGDSSFTVAKYIESL